MKNYHWPSIIIFSLVIIILTNCNPRKYPIYIEPNEIEDCACDTTPFQDCWCDTLDPVLCECDSTIYRDCWCDTLDLCACDTSIYYDNCWCDTDTLLFDPCPCDTSDCLEEDCPCDPDPCCCDSLECDEPDCWCDDNQVECCFCDTSEYDDPDCDCDDNDPPKPTELSYSKTIQPIWDSNCIECHYDMGETPNLTPGNSYRSIVPDLITTYNLKQSRIYEQVESGNMPDGGQRIPQKDIDNILEWLNNGYPNN